MRTPLPLIHESLEELQQRLRQHPHPRIRPRIHLLVLIQSRQVTTRQQAAKHLAVHRNTIADWLRRYQQGGLEALTEVKPTGPAPGQTVLPAPVVDALQERLRDPAGFGSYGEVQHWLLDEFGLQVKYKTIYRILRYEWKAKLKRARPSHAKKNGTKPFVSTST